MDALAPSVRAAASFPSSGNVYQITTGLPVAVEGIATTPVSRALALSVPAVSRGVDLLATTVAGLPIERVDAAGNRTDLGWIEQPEAGRSRYATLIDICHDLIMDGKSYMRVVARDASGAPRRGGTEYVGLERVSRITIQGKDTIAIDGREVDPSDIIGFEGWHSGIRHHGARIIRTALALEAAARRYADNPAPIERLRNVSTYEMDDEEIADLIAKYKASRNAEGVSYTNAGIEVDQVGWDAAQLQLVEARQFTAAMIANLVGVPSHLIAGAAAAAGGSITYANVSQENRAFIDYGLKPLARSIEARLSLSDAATSAWTNQVTPRGTVIRFNFDALLRGNPLERAQLYQILIPLGVLTVDEARAMEDLTPTGRQPQ